MGSVWSTRIGISYSGLRRLTLAIHRTSLLDSSSKARHGSAGRRTRVNTIDLICLRVVIDRDLFVLLSHLNLNIDRTKVILRLWFSFFRPLAIHPCHAGRFWSTKLYIVHDSRPNSSCSIFWQLRWMQLLAIYRCVEFITSTPIQWKFKLESPCSRWRFLNLWSPAHFVVDGAVLRS